MSINSISQYIRTDWCVFCSSGPVKIFHGGTICPVKFVQVIPTNVINSYGNNIYRINK